MFITHSSESAGGAEDDFDRIILHFSICENYSIDVLGPEGPRYKSFKNSANNTGSYWWGFFPVIYEGIIPYLKYFIKSIVQICQIWKFIKGKKYDLCVMNVSVLLWPMIFMKLNRIKTIVFIRETIEPALIRKKYYRFLSRLGEYFISVSNSIERDFRNITENNNIETLYSSVENQSIENIIKKRLNLPHLTEAVLEKIYSRESTKLVSVGEFGKRKNQMLLLESLICLRENNVELPYVFFVGKFNNRSAHSSEVLKYIRLNDLQANCYILGELHREPFLILLSLMDAVVISSLSEGMPLTIADSLMLGKPVISTKVGGIPEIIIDNYNGFLVDINTKSFAEGIIKFIEKKPFDKSFRENAIKSHALYFDLNRNMNRLNRIFEDII